MRTMLSLKLPIGRLDGHKHKEPPPRLKELVNNPGFSQTANAMNARLDTNYGRAEKCSPRAVKIGLRRKRSCRNLLGGFGVVDVKE